ncbi:MAG: hypothetical protein ACXVDN_15680 [Ktedonobacteraceae bacterium]
MKSNDKMIQGNVLPRLLQVVVAVGVQRAKPFAGARGVLAPHSLLTTGVTTQILKMPFTRPIVTQGFPMLAKKGLQRAARPLPEREAAHLGDAIVDPRTLHFSLVP